MTVILPASLNRSQIFVVLVGAFSIGGCAADPLSVANTTEINATALTDRDLPRRPFAPVPGREPGETGAPPYVDSLTLGQAVGRVLNYNPGIKAAFYEIEAKHGEAAQAAVKPNPDLAFEVENFGEGVEPEATLQLSQVIELGDKRVKRLRAAELDAAVAGWDYEGRRVEAIALAADAFVDVLATQERLKVLEDFVGVSDRTVRSVKARVTAGKSSPIENDRAAVTHARSNAILQSEKAKLIAAKRKLAALWGSTQTDFSRASGQLAQNRSVPSLDRIQAYLTANPDVARWSDEIGRRHALLAVEHSKTIPDVTLSAGLRRFEETDSTAFLASVSMPIQIFDRNVGNVVAAERRIDKASFEEEAARSTLSRTVVEIYGQLTVAAEQLKTLKKSVIPAAERAFAKTRVGYNEGKFDLLNVLDTQRAIFEARLDFVNAKAAYEKARVQLEALIGRRLSDV